MIHCNKDSFDNISTKVTEATDKINNIEHTKKDLEVNILAHKVKQQNLKSILRNLKADNLKVDDLEEVQDNIIYNLIGNVDRTAQIFKKSKTDFEARVIVHNSETKKYQEGLLEEFKTSEDYKKNLIKNEKSIIKLILGMNIIKK
jgi:CCR4-NOT transcriptional regulation complex NOT5 subunit